MAETLEEILDKATDPSNTGNNEALANDFCDQVNREFDGPHHAIKLIIQKLQLHQEVISLQVLNVVEQCVKSCGKDFHAEIGKYRFLNELIKLLSPKYDASITPQVVKSRVTQLLFGWYCGLPQETKIGEAYKMLKQQGVITRDPVDKEKTMPTYSEQARNTVFQDDEKAELLATLLKSSNPDDLQAANRLIKTMVKQEEERLEKVSQRVQELETVSNNVKLLTEMLDMYSTSISQNDKDLMKDLYDSCVNMRPQLFRLASLSAEERDDSITEILQASDSLTKVIDEYQLKVLGERQSLLQSNNKPNRNQDNAVESGPASPSLLDLGFDSQPIASSTSTTSSQQQPQNSMSSDILNDQLELLGLNDPPQQSTASSINNQNFAEAQQQQQQQPFFNNQSQFNTATQAGSWPAEFTNTGPQFPAFPQPVAQAPYGNNAYRPASMNSSAMTNRVPYQTTPTSTTVNKPSNTPKPSVTKPISKNPLDHLSLLDFPNQQTVNDSTKTTPVHASTAKVDDSNSSKDEVGSLLDLDDIFSSAVPPSIPAIDIPKIAAPVIQSNSEDLTNSLSSSSSTTTSSSSDAYFVPLEAIQPLNSPPVNIMDKNGIKTVLHFAKDTRETASPLVIVAILSTMSTNVTGVKNFTLQAAVPKNMRLKLQPPSSNELSPFNPILPLPSITQVMLVANPGKDRVRIKFRINGICGAEEFVETKDIDDLKSS